MSNSLSRQLRTTLFYALRTAFRLTPMPQATRDRLRQRFLDTRGHWVPEGPKGKAPTGELPRRPYVRSDERAIGYVPYEKGELPDPLPATLVAFYLPQFHTIPENDEWWGKGFTEWRNVARALPQFEGHHQPKLPGDLGFYDLRNVEVMHEQARLAREYGISAFCFYFYWFGGKTLLETPLRNWLNDKSIDLEFCLCWANEKWTRTWDGRGDEILIDQQHSPEDDIAFIEYVAEYMRDPRYLRVDGKPMLLVYRPGLFPDMAATALRWRRWCRDNGVGEIHLTYVQSFESPNPETIGFDAAVAFPPNLASPRSVALSQSLLNPDFDGEVFDWRDLSRTSHNPVQTGYPLHPCVNPGWDNEARRPGRGRVFIHASPRGYSYWLDNALLAARQTGLNTVFINAWNEWAEGAILEPDASLGYANLAATRKALLRTGSHGRVLADATYVVLHAWHLDVMPEILSLLRDSGVSWRALVTGPREHRDPVRHLLESHGLDGEFISVENRGRDILPFVQVAGRLLDQGVDVVLKLHTKRSLHRSDGDSWRNELLQDLLTGDRASKTLRAFREQDDLGIVGPAGHLLPVRDFLGGNRRLVTWASSLIGIPSAIVEEALFVSGSMFWVRLNALRPLLDARLYPSDFEPEHGQIDGTLAHALERLMGACALDAGFTVQSSVQACGEEATAHHGSYRFAAVSGAHSAGRDRPSAPVE